jgi:ATP-dependent DNA helicase RecQ
VLLGRESERIRQWRHDQVSTYGIGKELGEKEWRAVFRQLVALGMLEVDHTGFGALRLAEASRPVLRGAQTVMLRKQVESRPAQARAAAPAAGLGGDGNAVWERLRAWRSETAKAHGVPAYVIFHDATLIEIARACPGSLARLRDVPGIGAAKLDRYGEALLEICRVHAAEHGLTAQKDAAPVTDVAVPPPTAPQYDGLNETTSLSLHLMLEEGLNIGEIAARRGLKESTVYGHFAAALEHELVELEAIIPLSLEERATIAAALLEQQANGEQRLKAVFEQFEGRYGYGVLKCVAATLSRSGEAGGSG